ncbi:MAG: glycine--tRNA ligase [Candidatus Marsarchaeota archaeon]|nr:glycine--tRNA ligase [Candidatus Marsarchaeota archaeon]
MSGPDRYDKIIELCRRRGLFYPSFEVYGGVSGLIDYGPLGARIKVNLLNEWRRFFVDSSPDLVYETESPLVTPENVLEASGHLSSFTDPVTTCTSCSRTFRADHVLEESGLLGESMTMRELDEAYSKGVVCPVCGGKLGKPAVFNLLFKTSIGPYASSAGYIRPETAQGMFTMFRRAYEAVREKPVFGLAQIGRVGRNEVSPRQGPIRLREFTQMEIEMFFDPEDPSAGVPSTYEDETLRLQVAGSSETVSLTAKEALEKGLVGSPWLAHYLAAGKRFVEGLGVEPSEQYFLQVPPGKLPHYSKETWDQMVRVERWGWVEVAGYSYRGDFDLVNHARHSKSDFTVYKQLREPVKLVRKVVRWDAGKIRRLFGAKTGQVIAKLKNLTEEEINEFSKKGVLEIEGLTLGPEAISLSEEEYEERGRRYVPHVVEPSFGADRLMYAMIDHAYTVREDRVVLMIPRRLAYPSVGVLPLMAKDGLDVFARQALLKISHAGFTVTYDEEGAIGRRYARLDEVGVPVAVTVDYTSLEDGTVTLRDRDSWRQVRVSSDKLTHSLDRFIHGGEDLESLGEPLNKEG